MTYTVVLLRESDGRYSVSVPALKGCHTWGDTLPEALSHVQGAIRLFVESLRARAQPVPEDTPDVSVNMSEAAEAFIYRVHVEEAVPVA
jgi:antitoxin HicB